MVAKEHIELHALEVTHTEEIQKSKAIQDACQQIEYLYYRAKGHHFLGAGACVFVSEILLVV